MTAWMCGIVLLCAMAAPCRAQRYSFRAYTDGLHNLNINSIAQDRTGYLWVGTENGLFRYDGSQFREYGSGEGLNARIIEELYLGPDGTLWVGTTTGLYFERRNGNFAEVRPPGGTGQFVLRGGTAFTAPGPDQVAVAVRIGGFLLRHGGPDLWTAEPLQLESGTIWSVLAAPGGVLWYGCGEDLCRMKGGKTAHMGAALHLPQDHWMHLLNDRHGHLWLRGTTHLGEVKKIEEGYAPHDLPGSLNAGRYGTMALDAHGDVVAIDKSGFGLWEGKGWRIVKQQNGLPRFDLSTLFVDREGSIWLGVVGHGVSHWTGRDHWEAYTATDGLSDDIVWASMRDRSGRLWVATESGLDWIPPGENSARAWQSSGISAARSITLAESADGAIWMGSETGSLVRIAPKTLAGKEWKLPEVYRVLSDDKHRLWAATSAGMYVVDTEAWRHGPKLVENSAFSRAKEFVYDLSLDSNNRLWAATEQGLLRLDETGWRQIVDIPGGAKPSLLVADRDGNLWIAGEFSGLMRLTVKGDKVIAAKKFGRPQMLSDQAVSLFVDHRGWLWVGQDAGLTVYDGKAWRSFTEDDGLIWNDTDGNGLFEDRDGSMWIGTSGGLSHLIKPRAVSSGPPESLVISQISFGTSPITAGASIPWSASALSISVGSLSFRDERRIRVRYRLVGLQPEWEETIDKSIRYARLAPGDYRFQAAAVDAYSGAVSKVEEISFTIAPRWWQNLWLKLAVAILAAIGVVVLWRWSFQLLVWQKRQLEQAVKLRTDDLEREKVELLHAREQMRHFAEHDGLTGLWNHRVILERLRQEVDRSMRNGTPLSVILVDLDHFKYVNDAYGHQAGDAVLRKVSSILVGSVRSYDWVGRYGGEEFLLILPGSGFVSARIRAEQMRLSVQNALIREGEVEIAITASFGVASGLRSSFEPLIQSADQALYRAKDNGRNCVEAVDLEPPETLEVH